MIAALPVTLAPPAPFPLVVAQSQTAEFVAPGIRRATYLLQTTGGPLVVNVVAVDPREPTVRFDSVVANDRMISLGETVSSMARRTGAVAGVNADYFDIGNTNQPLGIVVRAGELLRTPSQRVVLDVRGDRTIHFDTVTFAGNVRFGATTIPLTAVNEWPPEGGAAFLSPAYGVLRPAPGVRVAEIVPAASAHLAESVAGTYRVASVDDATAGPVNGALLGFGPAAQARGPLPSTGDTVTIEATTNPALDAMSCAVGGGPLLLAAGVPFDDPSAPAPEERDRRFPVSGAASRGDGELLLIGVDGRQPSLSVGVTRPQFAALMLALGASDGMAFDSGGSATLVARVLGDSEPSVLGSPSDGEERPVADGLFVYSDAPHGPAVQLVVRPAPIVALAGATVPVSVARIDAAGHALGAASATGGNVVRAGAASSVVTVRAGTLSTMVPVEVVAHVVRVDVAADTRDADAGSLVHLTASGFDARGRIVQLGDGVRWSADRGRFVAPGAYRASTRDARIVASVADARGELTLRVGRHREALPMFDATHAASWTFASVPERSPGSVSFDARLAALALRYDFSGATRAAYANGTFALPGEPLAFALDIDGDGRGVGVRVAFVNRFGERRALTLSRAVDWNGWQTRTVRLPDDLNPPVQLVSVYAVDSLARAATHATGTIAFRNAVAIVAGTP